MFSQVSLQLTLTLAYCSVFNLLHVTTFSEVLLANRATVCILKDLDGGHVHK